MCLPTAASIWVTLNLRLSHQVIQKITLKWPIGKIGSLTMCVEGRIWLLHFWPLTTTESFSVPAISKAECLRFSTEMTSLTSLQFSSVAQSCLTLCDPMNRSTPGLPVYHQLLEFTQTHVHRVSDTIKPSHPLSSPSPPARNPSQHQSIFQWVNSSHEVAKTDHCFLCHDKSLTSSLSVGLKFLL